MPRPPPTTHRPRHSFDAGLPYTLCGTNSLLCASTTGLVRRLYAYNGLLCGSTIGLNIGLTFYNDWGRLHLWLIALWCARWL